MKLDPLRNPNLFKTMVGELLTPEECALIRSRLTPDGWRAAGVTNEDHPGGVIDVYTRSVLGHDVPLDDVGWPLTLIRDVISEINDQVWRFELTGFAALDYPSVLRYEADVNDHFHSHSDVGPAFPTRKLSFSVQLTDPGEYRGGELLFNGAGRDPNMRRQGTITVFPSMLHHEVTPIFQGTRDAIVGWVHGPTFR